MVSPTRARGVWDHQTLVGTRNTGNMEESASSTMNSSVLVEEQEESFPLIVDMDDTNNRNYPIGLQSSLSQRHINVNVNIHTMSAFELESSSNGTYQQRTSSSLSSSSFSEEIIPWYLQVQIWHLAVAMIATFLSSSVIFARNSSSSSSLVAEGLNHHHSTTLHKSHHLPQYSCPTLLSTTATAYSSSSLGRIPNNHTNKNNTLLLEQQQQQLPWRIMTTGETYHERKQYRSLWLKRHFSSLLYVPGESSRSSSILELSCGTFGFDLIMTQEIILEEVQLNTGGIGHGDGIESSSLLHLYGTNTRGSPSSSLSMSSLSSQPLVSETETPQEFVVSTDREKKDGGDDDDNNDATNSSNSGIFLCEVDIGMSPSTFIPSQSFDAVFISATNVEDILTQWLQDGQDPSNPSPTVLQSFCPTSGSSNSNNINSSSSSVQVQIMTRLARNLQEDWYARQVTQALYLVQPGKIVAIEDIPLPSPSSSCSYNNNNNNSFRVAKDWWTTAVKKFRWPVNVTSIVVEDQEGRKQKQQEGERYYNVILRRIE